MFAEPEAIYKFTKDKVAEAFDKEKFNGLVSDFAGVIPRGLLRGYSLVEYGGMDRDSLNDLMSYGDDRISIPRKYYKFGKYTYEECLFLVDKLKETKIFEDFCSDNLIELVINGKEIFCQLLGYYNGDRNIIIYGDEDNIKYNYHFYSADEGDYPDMDVRIKNFEEVVIDSNEGFLNKELENNLDEKNLPTLPLLFHYEPNTMATMPGQERLNIIGAVLESLLILYSELKNDFGERCQEGNLFKIIQFYIRENKGFEIGDYTYLELGDVFLPFSLDEVSGETIIKAKRRASISIGNYAVRVLSEKKPTYITFVVDNESHMIIGADTSREEDMHDIKRRIIDMLEKNNIYPNEIVFNNEFSYELFDELLDVYELWDSFSFDNSELNELYQTFIGFDFGVTSTGFNN